jgi:GNAT superfamily N-acetyltransferase
MTAYPFADLELARRLERCEAQTSMSFVEARARLVPERGAAWMERNGTLAMFDGPASPLTQTFCMGLFAPPAAEDLDAIEEFFAAQGAPVLHEVSPLAGLETYSLLASRGYQPVELTSVLFQPIALSGEPPPAAMKVRIAGEAEAATWSETAAKGWEAEGELLEFLRDVGRVTAASEGMHMFVAELEGQPVATGSLAMHGGVAHLAGASTLPSARNRGAQRALLDARLRYAAANGCTLATMGAAPGSASQRNAERRGFRIAYTRMKWARL